jgi:hypothetical protein
LFVYAKFLAPNVFGNSLDVVYVSLSDYHLIPDHRALLYSYLLLAERNSHLALVADRGCWVALPRWIAVYNKFLATLDQHDARLVVRSAVAIGDTREQPYCGECPEVARPGISTVNAATMFYLLRVLLDL